MIGGILCGFVRPVHVAIANKAVQSVAFLSLALRWTSVSYSRLSAPSYVDLVVGAYSLYSCVSD